MQALRKLGYSRRGPYRTRGSGYLRSRRSVRKPTRYGGQGRYYRYGGGRRLMRGMGAYVENAIVSSGMPGAHNPVPSFTMSPEGSITLSNKEYVGDIYAPITPSAFQNNVYPINPAIEKTFPWLCQVAENYDEYTLKQCIFTYKSSVADFASASGQVGQVIMATQYNASQAPFQDKQTMMQYAYACSGKTSEDMLQGVECDPTKLSGPKGRFTRNGPVPSGYFGDLNNYDHGQLNLAISDCPATYAGQQMGELWVSYTIELRKPKFVTANGWGISRDVWAIKVNNFGATPFGLNNGTDMVQGQQNSIGTYIFRPDAVNMQLPNPASTTIPFARPTINLFGGAPAANDFLMFAIIFPSSYSGNLRLTLSRGAAAASAGPPAVSGIIPDVKIGASPTSNIRIIRDIFDGSGAGQDVWQGFLGQVGVSGAAGATTSMLMDINVSPPTQGWPNVLVFMCANGTGQDNSNANVYLDIAEYNTLFNYRQDGTNDQICFVNASTNAIQIL